jgi:SAM-dependent methyltransferase
MVTKYDETFYSERHIKTLHFARRLAAIIVDKFSPSSAVDVGCGVGTVLASLKVLGCGTVLGLEGPWLDITSAVLNDEELKLIDLETPFKLDRTFDIAISLEVAEHLYEGSATPFVKKLCKLSDIVIFSAAIPGQGGVNHFNEQWQAYWAQKFTEHGYFAFDLVRPLIWADVAIPLWYKQNTVVYMSSRAVLRFPTLEKYRVNQLTNLNLVHPELYTVLRNQLAHLQKRVAG